MDLNHHSRCGAFTTPWARQCPPTRQHRRWRKVSVFAGGYDGLARRSFSEGGWRKVKESNPRPRGRPGFRNRLRTTAHHLPDWLVVPARLERATSAVGMRCSRPLSYGTAIFVVIVANWSGWLDSNQRPPASEAGTLAGLSYTLLEHDPEKPAPDLIRGGNGFRISMPSGSTRGIMLNMRLALRREIESLSPDGQSGRLTRCVTEQFFRGGPGRIRTCGELALLD
jgi:hypothetical protein